MEQVDNKSVDLAVEMAKCMLTNEAITMDEFFTRFKVAKSKQTIEGYRQIMEKAMNIFDKACELAVQQERKESHAQEKS
jgi:hypothetical protein